MRFAAIAVDYDGTLASQGIVSPQTLDALRRFSAAGRRLIMVTGRELDELLGVFPEIGIFDRVVAENGALMLTPSTGLERGLGVPPPPEFVPELIRRGVHPLSVGRSIVATVTPNETLVLETIRDLGLDFQVIFNKGAVMVLPAGVNKATGLAAALEDLQLSARNVAAIGDAENDHALLRLAEYGVAVANALPTLKASADRTSPFTHGAAVVELIDAILADDLRSWSPAKPRRTLVLGERRQRGPVEIAPVGGDILIAGASGSGKSVYATGVLERLEQHGYQCCVIDPEGDYAGLSGAVVLGGSERGPTLEEVANALENPHTNVVVNLSGLRVDERPKAFKQLLPRLNELRASIGRPHWILVGEAHDMYPARDCDEILKPRQSHNSMLYVTVHPEKISPAVLDSVDMLLAIGADSAATVAAFCKAVSTPYPTIEEGALHPGEALLWMRRSGEVAFKLTLQPSDAERRGQRRKMAQGELAPERSFYFRGPQERQNLRAQNLALFLQIGNGVDDETWLHHLQQGDYSRWLGEATKDPDLSARVAQVERDGGSVEATRRRINAAVDAYLQSAVASDAGPPR